MIEDDMIEDDMKEQLEQRLKELKNEFETGQKTLAELEARQANLRNTLLRISGAIQVLEEELAKENSPNGQDVKEKPLEMESTVQ
jgi:uncharacterized coiled-coil protein SlyX